MFKWLRELTRGLECYDVECFYSSLIIKMESHNEAFLNMRCRLIVGGGGVICKIYQIGRRWIRGITIPKSNLEFKATDLECETSAYRPILLRIFLIFN